MDLGSTSMSLRIEAPVVLNPEHDSKTASAMPGMAPEITKGAAPTMEHTSHVKDTTKNPSLDLNFSGEGLMRPLIRRPVMIQNTITVPNPKAEVLSSKHMANTNGMVMAAARMRSTAP